MSEPAGSERAASSDRANWLVQGEPVTSGALMRAIADDPDTRVVKSIARDMLLLEMTVARAQELTTRFGPALIIERDQPLTQIE